VGSGTTYTVAEGDEGGSITLSVTDVGANSGGTTVASAVTSTVIDATPSITVSVGGTAQEGQTLSAMVSGAESDDTLSYAWISNGGTVGTGATYTVQEGDEGGSITLTVTDVADNGGGTATTSAVTAAVTDAAPTIASVSISGVAQEGQVLTATPGAKSDGDDPVTYQWYSCGTVISGATNPTYTVAEGDETKAITVVATVKNDNGLTASKTSAATAAVIDAAPTLTAPVISGVAEEGMTLTATAATPNEPSETVVSYQWQANHGTGFVNISGATFLTYTVKEADEGATLQLVATSKASDGLGTTSTSTPTLPVTDQPATLGTPTITGTAQEGQTLTSKAVTSTPMSQSPTSGRARPMALPRTAWWARASATW
jgi:hypothetical protein